MANTLYIAVPFVYESLDTIFLRCKVHDIEVDEQAQRSPIQLRMQIVTDLRFEIQHIPSP